MRKAYTKGKETTGPNISEGQGWALGPETMKKGKNGRQGDWGDCPDESQS